MSNPMTAQEALQAAIEALIELSGHDEHGVMYNRYAQAAHILRNGTEPLEVVENGHHVCKCLNCLKIYEWKNAKMGCCPECGIGRHRNYAAIIANKKYTTRQQIKIETVQSKPVYEEVKE